MARRGCASDPVVWAGDRQFVAARFVVELADLEDDLFEPSDKPFRIAVKPGLRLLRKPLVHQTTIPGGGLLCSIASPDAQVVVRLTPGAGRIDVHCRQDPIAAVRFAEYVAAATDALRWRVADLAADEAPPPIAAPPYAMLFGRVVAQQSSEAQRIVLSEHPVYGDILVLGGEIQIGTRDVEAYSRALIDPGITEATRRVLILGGGDCGVLRAVLRHPVERAVMVELDPQVVSFCQTHMPGAMGDALSDRRAELRFEDAFAYMRDCTEHFDLVVWDLPDIPIGGFTIHDRVVTLARLLSPGGRLVAHSDCWEPEGGNNDVPIVSALRRQFGHVELQRRSLPCFQDYPWLFLCAWSPHGVAP